MGRSLPSADGKKSLLVVWSSGLDGARRQGRRAAVSVKFSLGGNRGLDIFAAVVDADEARAAVAVAA